MAANKPVVVNSTPWMDNAQIELVDNGKTGFVSDTPKTFAASIAHLIEDKKEARKMGIAGHEKVRKEYDTVRTTKMLERIYLEFLSKKGLEGICDLVDKYEEMQYFPTDYQIVNFRAEYHERMNERFDKPYPVERLSFRSRCMYEWVRNLRREQFRRRQLSGLERMSQTHGIGLD
jgi:hypothetical protein